MFEPALKIVLRNEGGYANNPKDPGGATNFGITQSKYNSYRQAKHLSQIPVKEITHEEVTAIYRDIWRTSKSDILSTFRPYLAIAHFDCAVNTGDSQAAKILQRAVLADDDGIIGPNTIKSIRQCEEEVALRNELEWRAEFYQLLVKKRPTLKVFLKTWNNRIEDVRAYIEYLQKNGQHIQGSQSV